MKKEMLYGAICLILLSAINTNAQETKPSSNVSGTQIPDERSSNAGATLENSATATPATGATLAAQEEVKEPPVFPDSLMRNYEVEVFQNVLKMADLAGFKYKDMLANAKAGDVKSLYKLLDFHRVVDGVDALNHAVTCLELIPLTGDRTFATAVNNCPPKLKKVLLDRLMLAQVRTKKTFLRQSLTNWAPITWAFLNGREAPQSAATTIPQPADPQQTIIAPESTTPPSSRKQ